MLENIGVKEEERYIPDDYLEFVYKMSKLKERYNKEGKATTEQVRAIVREWYLFTDEILEPPEVVTRGYIINKLNQISNMKKKRLSH